MVIVIAMVMLLVIVIVIITVIVVVMIMIFLCFNTVRAQAQAVQDSKRATKVVASLGPASWSEAGPGLLKGTFCFWSTTIYCLHHNIFTVAYLLTY